MYVLMNFYEFVLMMLLGSHWLPLLHDMKDKKETDVHKNETKDKVLLLFILKVASQVL